MVKTLRTFQATPVRMATDGSRTLDSGLRDPKWCCEARSVILDLGRSGEKSRLSSFELKSHLLSFLGWLDSLHTMPALAWYEGYPAILGTRAGEI